MSIIIPSTDFELFETVEQLLQQMAENVTDHLLTRDEEDLIETFYRRHTKINADEISAVLDEYVRFYTDMSAKSCLHYSNVKSDDNEIFYYIAQNYEAIMDYAVILIRQSLLARSLTQNGNSSIKSISSNGRSVSFMSANEINSEGLPQSIKDRLPKPRRVVRVW